MSQDEIHVGDKGTTFNVTLYDGTSVLDISAATAKTFEFRSPAGSITTVTASFVSSGTAGALTYVVDTTTTLATDGNWKLQAIITFASSKFHSDIYTFKVWPNLT